jgi:TPR repeat protein
MLRRCLALVLFVVALASTPQAVAGSFEDGVDAAQRGNYATALRLWRQLAERGDADAQFNLGRMYDRGEGVPQDYARAVSWYRKAADQGDADAQLHLGVMYALGHGVAQNYVQAVSWYRKATAQENAAAQVLLGLMYASGQGVPQDYVQAHMWVNLAASRATDPELRGSSVKARDALAAKMTREQIARAQQLALEWKPKGK